jgi:hypothetical protein
VVNSERGRSCVKVFCLVDMASSSVMNLELRKVPDVW